METLKSSDFGSEYHKRIIAFHILGMHRWTAQRAALYYFGNSQYELATRLAEHLMNQPDLISNFLSDFPISTARYAEITDALLRSTVPDFRSFGLTPKMVREIPTSPVISGEVQILT